MSRPKPKAQDFSLASLQSADLLPQQFREQRLVLRTMYVWAAMTLASFAILAGTVAAFWAQARRIESQRTRVIADAAPLKHVRDEVVRLKSGIDQLQTNCDLVESAKPSDELLQTLATIAVISQDSQQEVMIEAIEVRLPLEYPSTETSPPNWAESALSITMTFPDGETTKRWLQRLEESDRIERPIISQAERIADSTRTTLTAKPLAITELP